MHVSDHKAGNYIKIGIRSNNRLVPEHHQFNPTRQIYVFVGGVKFKEYVVPSDVRIVGAKHFCRKCNKFSITKPEPINTKGQRIAWSRAVGNMIKHEADCTAL